MSQCSSAAAGGLPGHTSDHSAKVPVRGAAGGAEGLPAGRLAGASAGMHGHSLLPLLGLLHGLHGLPVRMLSWPCGPWTKPCRVLNRPLGCSLLLLWRRLLLVLLAWYWPCALRALQPACMSASSLPRQKLLHANLPLGHNASLFPNLIQVCRHGAFHQCVPWLTLQCLQQTCGSCAAPHLLMAGSISRLEPPSSFVGAIARHSGLAGLRT